MEAQDICVVLSAFPSEEEAVRAGRALVERRLVACVNLVPGARSIYRWQDRVEDEREVLAVMKTRRDRLPELFAALAALHPYQVPEILALPVAAGDAAYLAWVASEAAPPGRA